MVVDVFITNFSVKCGYAFNCMVAITNMNQRNVLDNGVDLSQVCFNLAHAAEILLVQK